MKWRFFSPWKSIWEIKLPEEKAKWKEKKKKVVDKGLLQVCQRLLILCFAEKKKKKKELLILKWKTRWRKTILILFLICNPPYLFQSKSEMKYVGMYDS